MADHRDPLGLKGNFAPGTAAGRREGVAAEAPEFHPADYDEFVALLGAERAASWLEHLASMLAANIDDGGDPDDLRKVAHAMVPLAGIPGFADLASRFTALEHAIANRSPYRAELTAVKFAAERAAITVSALRSDLAEGAR